MIVNLTVLQWIGVHQEIVPPPVLASVAPLDDPAAVAGLLDSLREAGAQQQAAALAGRLPRPACSGSTSSRKASRIGSGSDGKQMAPRPRHGTGKAWTYCLVLNTAADAETEELT
jgi:hypothetical protein